ncbi:MAG: hypothetical protein ABGX16_18155 [Pirellulales bacterium]
MGLCRVIDKADILVGATKEGLPGCYHERPNWHAYYSAGISHVCMAETPPWSSLETVDDGVVNAADYLLVQAVQTPARTPSAPTVPPSNIPLPLPSPPTIVPTLPQSTPTPNPAIASARRPRTSRFANTRIASRIPYMIGDSSGGGCGTLTFDGAPFADVEHPTFACSRLNIAENNSPIPQSRAFLSYRHFHNLSNTEILGESNSLNMDQYTLGLERASVPK